MPALARGQTSDCAYPVLDLYTTVAGTRTDVALAEFQIFELVTNPGVPVLVYPPVGRAVIDPAECPAGHKLDTGHYVAEWTAPLDEIVGTHEIRWYFRLSLAAPEATVREEFEILPEVTGTTSQGYTSVQALRDEGVEEAGASDIKLQALIARASQWIERWTGRWFEPRTVTFFVDGNGSDILMLDQPIIRILSLRFGFEALAYTDQFIELDAVRIYNRHITQRLTSPDDRDNPRIQFVKEFGFDMVRRGLEGGAGVWPSGTQNIEVSGVFGYTEYDGSPYGRTPLDIQLATQMLVVRELAPIGDIDGRQEAYNRGRVASMSTQGQSISYGGGSSSTSAPFSGDPQIDRLLAPYIRLPVMASV